MARPCAWRSPAPPLARPRGVEPALAGCSDSSRAGHREAVQRRASNAGALGLGRRGAGEEAVECGVDVGAVAVLGERHR